MSFRSARIRENHAEVDTGPLNDILFILLLFFLIVATLANPNVIKVSNPKAKSESKAKQSVVVSIDKDANVYVGQKKVLIDSLESVLKNYIREGDSIKPAVVVNADSTSHWGLIIKVMQTAKRLGATTSASVDAN